MQIKERKANKTHKQNLGPPNDGVQEDDHKERKGGLENKGNENKSNRVRTTDAFSGELPAYLSLNRLSYGIFSSS